MTRDADARLSGVAPLPQTVTLPRIAEDIAEDVARARFADHCEATEENLVERAVSGVEIASPLPIDEQFHADRRLIEDLGHLDRALADAQARAAGCRAREQELEDALVRTPPCWSRLRLACAIAAFVALALLAGVVVGAVLAPSLDAGFLANYLPQKFDGDARLLAMAMAYLASGGFVFLICVLQLCVVVAGAGKPDGIRALPLVVLDLLFAAAWGLQRYASGGGAMAASISLLEFVVMAAYALALGALGTALSGNAKRAQSYHPARAAARAATAARDKAESDLAAIKKARKALLSAVAERELSGRAAETRRALVAETARAAYRTSTGAAIQAATENPTLDRLHADLDRQLAARGAAVAEPPKPRSLS